MLVDPGTYAYHTQKLWRDYFRGTSAHNTVRIDYLDQSVPGGNFLWLQHAHSSCLSFESSEDEDCWIGEHDGYMRLPDPVKHQRSIKFDKTGQIITVSDTISARKKHFTELYWHLSEHCSVQVIDKSIVIKNKDVQLSMKMLDTDWHPEVLRGCEDPPLGWISRGFDQKVPIICLRWAGQVTGTTDLTTEIRIKTLV